MPYTTIPTATDGAVLSAAYLNTLSDNQEYLHGLANRANAPFNSYEQDDGNLDETEMIWFGRHRCRYFHYKAHCEDDADYIRIYYNGTMVAGSMAAGLHDLVGSYDLTSFAALPTLRGAWVTATAYARANNGDGDIVTNGGQYYKCTSDHTSGTSTQPGVGGSWATVWQLLTLPVQGAIFSCYARIAGGAVATNARVDYFFETDSATL